MPSKKPEVTQDAPGDPEKTDVVETPPPAEDVPPSDSVEEEGDPSLNDPELWKVIWQSYDVTIATGTQVYTFGDEIPIPLAEARQRHDCAVVPRDAK